MSKFFIYLIGLYQRFISPKKPSCCRFTPTCSRYAIDALKTHGALMGLLLTVCRILRCNPFCKSGYDPPPQKGQAIKYLFSKNKVMPYDGE